MNEINKIRVLDNNVINKIAAGEVIEKPASIIKELVENSIDASAKNITIEIKNGGIDYIKIQDDGIGIEKEQIKTAFLRHATSKLLSIDDLDNMGTLGFRGEALSSIASISRVEMITKTKNDDIGSKIVIEGGEIISESEVATLEGTTFIIRDIFFNTPARRKFLKKPSTEANYISDMVNKLALGNANICFKYENNGLEALSTLGDGNIKNTAFCVYGGNISENLISIKAEKDGFKLDGLVGLPLISRGNRGYSNFFINNRYVKSYIINKCTDEAYNGKLMTGKFPIFLLNLTVPENTIDVNVHPTKLEVRFENELFIYNFIKDSIVACLEDKILIPSIGLMENKGHTAPSKEKLGELLKDNFVYSSEVSRMDISIGEAPTLEKIDTHKNVTQETFNLISEPKFFVNNISDSNGTERKIIEKSTFFENYKIVGQIFTTYWIIEQDGEVYLIDQHSAHEKVIYEELYEKYRQDKIYSQKLLIPISLKVSPMEKTIIQENFNLLKDFGFQIEEFGLNTYAIRGVPFIFKDNLSPSHFIEILNELNTVNIPKNTKSIYDLKMEKIISMSCKKAVKANDTLSELEAKSLIEKMLKLENPFHCPHGRPTVVKITKNEIEKIFKRT